MNNHTPLMQEVVEPKIPQEYPIISPHALGILSPQTLKLQGYIKHCKVVVLVDSGRIDNFFHKRVEEETHSYVHLVSNF